MTVAARGPGLADAEHADLAELRVSQPGLWLQAADEGRLVLRGRLSLKDEIGTEVDSYLVELRIPRQDQPGVPDVFERGGRIPKIADRHVFTDTKGCCIEHPVEYLLRPRQRLAEYVNGQVRSYFIAQSYFEQFQEWPHGELGHGIAGTRELCLTWFGAIDLETIAAALELFGKPGAKHRPCPCGSGEKFMACHYDALRSAKRWPAAARAELVRCIRRKR